MNTTTNTRVLPVIFFTVLLDLISISILIPILPSLFANPDSPAYLLVADTPVSYGYIILGILIGTWSIAQFFSAPVMGELSDIYGRKKIIAISLAGVCLSHLLFAYGILVHSLTILFFARALGGILGSNLVVAQAVIADITPEKFRARNFGLIGAAYGIGFILGPTLGGLLSDASIMTWFNIMTPFLVAAALEVINIILVFTILPETHKPCEAEHPSWFKAITHIITAYSMKNLRAVFATNFFFQAGFAFFGTFLSVYLIHRFGFTQKGIGFYLAYGGLFIVLAQAFVVRYVSTRFKDTTILRWSLLLGSLSILAYYLPNSLLGLMLIIPLLTLTNGLSMAYLPAIVSKRASAKEQGEVLGINMSVQSLAYAIPPILSGFLAAKLTPEIPVYVGGAVIFIAWAVFTFGVKKEIN